MGQKRAFDRSIDCKRNFVSVFGDTKPMGKIWAYLEGMRVDGVFAQINGFGEFWAKKKFHSEEGVLTQTCGGGDVGLDF